MKLENYIHGEWKILLKEEFNKQYFLDLQNFINTEIKNGKTIYPKIENIFNALNITSFEETKIVIFGQDPYHGPNQAHGLAFSVYKGVKIPPSLKNIYKEILLNFPKNNSDFFKIPIKNNIYSGNLEQRAKKGILLLNSVLTVERDKANSHKNKGWEIFTNKVVDIINKNKSGVVFLLRGNDAQKKKQMIDVSKHFIIETTHPSPLSANKGFLGSQCFKKAEMILNKSVFNL